MSKKSVHIIKQQIENRNRAESAIFYTYLNCDVATKKSLKMMFKNI